MGHVKGKNCLFFVAFISLSHILTAKKAKVAYFLLFMFFFVCCFSLLDLKKVDYFSFSLFLDQFVPFNPSKWVVVFFSLSQMQTPGQHQLITLVHSLAQFFNSDERKKDFRKINKIGSVEFRQSEYIDSDTLCVCCAARF